MSVRGNRDAVEPTVARALRLPINVAVRNDRPPLPRGRTSGGRAFLLATIPRLATSPLPSSTVSGIPSARKHEVRALC